MSRPVPRRLEYRLLVALASAALLFSLVGGAALFAYSYGQEVERSRHTIDSLAATVRASAEIAVFVMNDEIADDVMNGLLRNDELLAVSLESDEGYQVTRWGQRPVREWMPDDEIRYVLHLPGGGEESIGVLRLLPDGDLLEARARRAALTQVTLMLGLTLLLSGIGLFAFRRLIGHPLHYLTRQLARVSPGQGHHVAIPPGHEDSEIGLLGDSLNRYLAASESAIASERALREQVVAMEAHYRRIFDSTNVGIVVLDLDGRVINCNPALAERLARIETPAQGRDDFFSRAFERPDKAWALVERARSSGHVASADLELRPAGGERAWVHTLISVSRTDDGGFGFIEGVLYDVTSRREREQAALRTAERDALTDLINRRGAEAYIERAIAEAERNHAALSVLYVDLDGFKAINDSLGHTAGDAVLIEVARRLAGLVRRASDLVSRLGGDEFVLAVYGCDKRDAAVTELAGTILSRLAEPILLPDGTSARIGASIGIASYPEDGLHRSELMYAVDQAMYAAKRRGRHRYVLAARADAPPAGGG